MSYNLLGKQTQKNVKEKHRYRLIKRFFGNKDLIYNVFCISDRESISKIKKYLQNKGFEIDRVV